MTQIVNQIRSLLDRLENEIELARESASVQALSGLELPDIMRDIIDLLFPHITPYQAAIYMYLVRHSVLFDGSQLVRASTRGMREEVVKSASGQSTGLSQRSVRESLSELEKIGAIQKQGEPNREGTPYRVFLPEEIEVCQRAREELRAASTPVSVKEQEVDYYNIRENRLKIYERDNYKCQHCGKQLTRFTSTLDHVTPVSKGGDNSCDNLVTSCLDCNSKKNARLLGDFMADTNPS
jgi:5-methylcytosine-specific restriction endonuclease McrA